MAQNTVSWKLADGSFIDGVPAGMSLRELAGVMQSRGLAAPVSRATAENTQAPIAPPPEYSLGADVGAGTARGVAGIIGLPYEAAKFVGRTIDGAVTEAMRGHEPTETLGLPSMSAEAAQRLEAFTPTQDSMALLNWLGVPTQTEAPQGFPGYAAQNITESLAPLGILGGVARLHQGLAKAHPLVEGFMAAPRATFAGELSAGGTSAAGGYLGKQFTEGPVGEIGGQVLGGMLSPIGYAGKAPGLVGKGKDAVMAHTTRAGRQKMAARKVQQALYDAGEDPKKIALRLDKENLTPAQAAESEMLLEIERNIIKKNPKKYAEYMAKVRAQTGQEVRALVSGSPQDVDRFYQLRLDRASEAAEKLVQQASDTAELKIRQAGPKVTRERASEIYNEQMERAYAEAKKLEEAAWDRIDPAAPTPLGRVKETYERILADRTKVDEDLPKFLDEWFGKDGVVSDVEAFKVARRMRTRLMKEIKKEDNRSHVREMQSLVDELTDVMGNINPAARHARGVSRDLNIRFREGTIGRMRGKGAYQTGRPAPGEALEVGLGERSGPKAGARVDELKAAAPSTEADSALRDYIKHRFFTAAIDGKGNYSQGRAMAYLTKNQALMDRFPGLKEELTETARSRDLFDEAVRTRDAELANLAQSQPSLYTQSMPDVKIKQALKSRNPGVVIDKLVSEARLDRSGAAMAGLKRQTLNEVISGAQTQTLKEGAHLDALGLVKRMKEYRPALTKILSNAELDRLDVFRRRLTRLELQQKTAGAEGGFLEEGTDLVHDLLIRLGGVEAISWTPMGRTSGHSLVVAGYGSRAAQHAFEKVPIEKMSAIVERAVYDKDFMKMLLTKPTSAKAADELGRRVHAYLASVAITDDGTDGEPDR